MKTIKKIFTANRNYQFLLTEHALVDVTPKPFCDIYYQMARGDVRDALNDKYFRPPYWVVRSKCGKRSALRDACIEHEPARKFLTIGCMEFRGAAYDALVEWATKAWKEQR